MARRIAEEDLEAIVGVVRQHEGATAQQIARTLGTDIPLRTLQYRLKQLVTAGRLTQAGGGRSAKYRMPAVEAVGVAAGAAQVEGRGEAVLPLRKPASKSRNMSAGRQRRVSPSDTIEDSLTPIVPTSLPTFRPERAQASSRGRHTKARSRDGRYLRAANLKSPLDRPVLELKPP